jgi:hypothetical protein
MSIDPITLPDGTVVEIERCVFAIREDGQISSGFVGGVPFMPTRPITRVFVPVPDGMTLADAEAALADAGAWVGVIDPVHCPDGARMMNRWTNGLGGDNLYVHRDDLPPTDPDAELVEAIAADLDKAWKACKSWDYEVQPAPVFSDLARAALAVVREHEATR